LTGSALTAVASVGAPARVGRDLGQGGADRPGVALVASGHVAQEARSEGDVTVLVASHVGEALHEGGQGAPALVEVDDEVLAGEREHALDDHVVDRHRLYQDPEILGLAGQAVHPAAQELVKEHAEVWVEVLAGLVQAALQPIGREHPHLRVEAVEERHVAGLVGDLRGQEQAHVLVGTGAHHRPKLAGHPLRGVLAMVASLLPDGEH